MSEKAIRVALCDDHRVVRSGLRRILEAEPDMEVVGEGGSAQECLAIVRTAQPDVLVLDIGLPGTNGIEVARSLRDATRTRILMLTVHDDVAYLRKAFEAGAGGYLVKEAADVELVLAVREVAAGRQYVHPRLGAALLEPDRALRVGGGGGELSDREVEVLRLIALGHTNAEIARTLFLSVRTVETHRAHVQQKLGVRNRAELVAYARENGVLAPGDDGP